MATGIRTLLAAIFFFSFSTTAIFAQGSFPFQLSVFKSEAKNGNVGLTWMMKNQDDLLQFEIEWSPDGNNYQSIGVVPASKTPNGASYSFEHTPTYADRSVYRLKMVSYNRQWKYSDPIIVDANKITKMFVYPSVITTGVMNIIVNEPFTALQVVSMNGTIMLKENIGGRIGRINIPLSRNLATGMYVVQLLDHDRRITQKVMIK
jgi:hypothetical protein